MRTRGDRKMVKSLTGLALAALLVGLPVALAPAYADPPSWAPAHGYRAKQAYQGLNFDPSFTACDTGLTGSDLVGGAIGATIGGLIGSQIGDGRGQMAATGAGVLLGAILGIQAMSSMTPADEGCAMQTLERAPEDQTVRWQNPDTNAHYTVTPTRTTEENGRYCREYTTTVTIGGKLEEAYGRACRQPDGSWQNIS